MVFLYHPLLIIELDAIRLWTRTFKTIQSMVTAQVKDLEGIAEQNENNGSIRTRIRFVS